MIPVRAYFTLLTKYLRPLRWRAAVLGLVLLAAITLQLINPQIIGRFIDEVTTGGDVDDLTPLAVAFMVIAVAQQLLRGGRHLAGRTRRMVGDQRAAGRPHRSRARAGHGVPQGPHPR